MAIAYPSNDPLEWPEMRASHTVKPAMRPYRIEDPAVLEKYILATIENLELPWVGDRIAIDTMRGIFTTAWYALTQLGFYDRLDEEQRARETPPVRKRVIPRR